VFPEQLPFAYLPASLAASSIQCARASSLIYLYALNQFDGIFDGISPADPVSPF
jgi:hypothetical protein